MNDQTDSQLLRAYAESHSELAFAELVRRHVDFVHSAALRMVCDSHLAQDVAQGVFVALAKNAPQLMGHPVLSGWLHRTAQNIAAQTVRTDVRRRAREQEAAAMNELLAHQSEAVWENIAPHLDAALGELAEPDRDALLLRYFERKSAREMALTLGVSEDAAQKRVARAVERLREFFAKRGVTIGAGGLVVLITANAVQAAPVGLAVAITAAVALTGTAVTTATVTATKAIAMTTFQKTVIGATLAVAVGAGIYEAHQTAALRAQVQMLQQQQGAPDDRVSQLQQERDDAIARQAAFQQQNERLQTQVAELPRLRGELTRLQMPQPQAQPQARPQAFTGTAQLLVVYADMTHRTILRGPLQPLPESILPLMLAEPDRAADVLNEELSKQGCKLVLDGEKFIQILPVAEATARTSPSLPGRGVSNAADQVMDFTSIDLGTFLGVCGGMFSRTILCPANLPMMTVSLRIGTPLTRDEAFHAIWVVLSLNGLALMPDGDKLFQLVPASEAGRVHANAPKPERDATLIQPAQVPVLKQLSPRPNFPRPSGTPPAAPAPAPATLDDLMTFYAKLLNKTFQPSPQFASRRLFFEVQTPLTKAELLYAVNTMLALNEMAIVRVDDKSIKLTRTSSRRSSGN